MRCLSVEKDIQVGKLKFLRVHFLCADPSECLVKPRGVEIPHTLGVRPVTLVSEIARPLPDSPFQLSFFFFQGSLASDGLDCQVWDLVISSLVSSGEESCKYFSLQGVLQLKKVLFQSCCSSNLLTSPSFPSAVCQCATSHLFRMY